ncbi:helix-turn-helix domain-containing protein [Desulfobacter curvatus]|uniref:helix-turn-helix domain-containing protein n=1 Tax=Desulfobacter curvatus TaxID=2290 RepID=UPI000381D1A1|nr:helix-turn-helix domain-containing protein [Desulfobacter curvatus]
MVKKKVSSGIPGLDRLLNGLFIGDNVVWYDDAGSLAHPFCMKFIQASHQQRKPIVYVSFDRSPKNLIQTLGPLAENPHLTILDCFTNGKGDKAEVFNKFYEKDGAQWPYQVIRVTEPWKPDTVFEAIDGLHRNLSGDVRFVMESLTGMQDLWEGEDQILKFYSHSCPKLYEMDTIAYWIVEKNAHSGRLRAHINQIAQVAVDLTMTQGRSCIKILKADKRQPADIGIPVLYSCESGEILFRKSGTKKADLPDLGQAVKVFRTHQGMSQKELARLAGVTPSTISQIESNQVFPSLPALYRIAEHLSVDVASFFRPRTAGSRNIFSSDESVRIIRPGLDKNSIEVAQLTPPDRDLPMDAFLITVLPGKRLNSHFMVHKGPELGYLVSGHLDLVLENREQTMSAGDTIFLGKDFPSQWVNPLTEPATLFWINMTAK